MNTIIKPSDLPVYLRSNGIKTINTEECAKLLGKPVLEVPQYMARLRHNGQMVSIARGLWAVVPDEYQLTGLPEPIYYLNSLMSFYDCEYCVGWLSAASLRGASHQVPQVFQVAVNKHLRNQQIGRNRIQYFNRSYVYEISKKKITTTLGTVYVATAGATMLMVASDVLMCGGIDNVATIILELADENPGYEDDLYKNAHLFPYSAVARVGWILENIGHKRGLNKLSKYCKNLKNPIMLSPYDSRVGKIIERWNVIENRQIQVDL